MKHALLPLFALLSLSLFAQAGPQLDSTVTYYGYWPGNNTDTMPYYRSVYSSPQPGVKTETQSERQGDQWMNTKQITHFYDNLDRLVMVQEAFYDPDNQVFIPEFRRELFPRGNSATRIDSSIVSYWDGIGNWLRALDSIYVYDQNDRLAESVSRYYHFGLTYENRQHYTYDDEGDNILIKSFDRTNGILYPTGQVQMRYEAHRLVEIIHLEYNGGGYLEKSRNTYAYTTFDSLALSQAYEWDLDLFDWFNTQTTYYTYNVDRLLESRETIYRDQAGLENLEKFVFEYLPNSPNLLVEHVYLFNEQLNAYSLDGRKYFYYQSTTSAPVPIRHVEALTLSPNPGTGPVRTSLEQEALVSVYSAGGQMLVSRQLQPGETLDLSAYPAGLYRVVARDGQKLFVGTAVKE